MLNSPTRTFEEPADDIAPLPSSEEIKVKYPLLYKAEKDGKTHYILGTCHVAALDYMPDYVLKIIEKCNVLVSESTASLPKNAINLIEKEGSFYKDFKFMNFLKDYEEDLRRDLAPFLKPFNTEYDLNSFSPAFLIGLFDMHIAHGAEYGKLRIDDSLVFEFEKKGKTIIELNANVYEEIIELFIAFEKEKKEMPEKLESFLLEKSKYISDNYCTLKKGRRNTTEVDEKILLSFLEEDLENPTMSDLITNSTKNDLWENIFLSAHEKYDGILLACGAGHLITSPNDPENAIIARLKKEGFSISRVTQEKEIDLGFQSLTLQYEYYQEQEKMPYQSCSNKPQIPISPLRMP